MPPALARSLGAATAALAALAVPATPAWAGGSACDLGRFTATSQADLAKITVLDPGPLAPELPALADVRLAPARSDVDSGRRLGRARSTAGYGDAKLLGMNLPGLPLRDAEATHLAPGQRPGPVTVALAALNAGGLATAQAGKATAAASWDDRYGCGKTGPLTRGAAMIEGLSLLGGGRAGGPAIQAVSELTRAASPTSLLKVGPTGSTQSATDLVKLGGGRIGVRAGAGLALSDLTLFAGTPQEITAKVLTQPTLEVVAGGDEKHSRVTYQPAVLSVRSGGKLVESLDAKHADVSLSLLGRLTADRPASLLSVRLSLGTPTQKVDGASVSATAASLRVEVKLGAVHLLDVAIGYLSVSATAPCRVGASTPRRQVSDSDTPVGSAPSSAEVPSGRSAASPRAAARHTSPASPAAGRDATSGPFGKPDSGTPSAGGLALTGSNVAAVGLGGVSLIVVGLGALFLTRRRRRA
ncbi:hypothetical protein GCM10010168_59160 [Actinoplanes ianthinogenes]|uniref:Gram-positive cocci surface proteins LPxTG domain-containing protein n=1 Tax=Actinoplanes ianthinogenes TaxID=122358 RepID=A0ABM7M211_9ACTN|nr:hypothetical protein [Actinoplanes ianthinogenes]BCJ45663.1 hypothetical protein Aiant_63200 [Actinoplanes ianthinogenes]GGR32866.1 hypothetical protein GCM10010168_59160 [Actinoplanes ianthinogenes]